MLTELPLSTWNALCSPTSAAGCVHWNAVKVRFDVESRAVAVPALVDVAEGQKADEANDDYAPHAKAGSNHGRAPL